MPQFPTPTPISVRLEVALGNVHVIAADRVDTVVAVAPADPRRSADVEAAAQAEVVLEADSLVVRGLAPRGIGKLIGPTRRSGMVEIVIELPEDSHVRSEAALGNFRSDGRLGDVHVKTGAGHLRVEHAARLQMATGAGSVAVGRSVGHAKLRAAGDISVGSIGAEAEVRNLNGPTTVGQVDGALRVRSANGDITIGSAEAEVDVKTANGSIVIDEVVRGAVVLQTASGGLDIGIRHGTAAWVDARSQFGRVTNQLEPSGDPGPAGTTVQIRARTAYGDIGLRRPRTAKEHA